MHERSDEFDSKGVATHYKVSNGNLSAWRHHNGRFVYFIVSLFRCFCRLAPATDSPAQAQPEQGDEGSGLRIVLFEI